MCVCCKHSRPREKHLRGKNKKATSLFPRPLSLSQKKKRCFLNMDNERWVSDVPDLVPGKKKETLASTLLPLFFCFLGFKKKKSVPLPPLVPPLHPRSPLSTSSHKNNLKKVTSSLRIGIVQEMRKNSNWPRVVKKIEHTTHTQPKSGKQEQI